MLCRFLRQETSGGCGLLDYCGQNRETRGRYHCLSSDGVLSDSRRSGKQKPCQLQYKLAGAFHFVMCPVKYTREIWFQWSLNHSSPKLSDGRSSDSCQLSEGVRTCQDWKVFHGRSAPKSRKIQLAAPQTLVCDLHACASPDFSMGDGTSLTAAYLNPPSHVWVPGDSLAPYTCCHSRSTGHGACSGVQPRPCNCNPDSEGKNADVRLKQERTLGPRGLKLCLA